MQSTPLFVFIMLYQSATGAPTSRNDICMDDRVFEQEPFYKCPGTEDEGVDTRSTPFSQTMMVAGLVVAGLVTVALLAWALYSYLSQVCYMLYTNIDIIRL